MKTLYALMPVAGDMIAHHMGSSEPLLVLGRHGSGKVHSVLQALKTSRFYDLSCLDTFEIRKIFESDDPLVLDELDEISEDMVPVIREFLLKTHRTVVCCATFYQKVHPDLHACFLTAIEVGV